MRYSVPIPDGEVDRLLAIDGVVSVGEGLVDGERGIVVGVDDPALQNDSRIPATIDGLPVGTIVEERPGTLEIDLPGEGLGEIPMPVSANTIQRHRPVVPGISIAHINGTAGTVGFIAEDGSILSNSHVLADYGEWEAGGPVVQPGPYDGGSAEDKIGTLAGNVPPVDENLVDVAWANANVDVDNEINGIGTPDKVADPELGDTVKWSGRTSGVKTATVKRVNVTVTLSNGMKFVDQFEIDNPLIAGDSGSPIVREDDDDIAAVGLGFAGTSATGFCNKVTEVLDRSKKTLDLSDSTDTGVCPPCHTEDPVSGECVPDCGAGEVCVGDQCVPEDDADGGGGGTGDLPVEALLVVAAIAAYMLLG